MILQQPLERGPQGRAQRDPRAASGASGGLDARCVLGIPFFSSTHPFLPFRPGFVCHFLKEASLPSSSNSAPLLAILSECNDVFTE